jgi:hypothetical protein
MGIFLKREEVSRKLEWLFYGAYFAFITIVHLVWHIPVVNLIVSILGLLGITSVYPESKTKKYLAVLFVYSMGIVLDVLVMSALQQFIDPDVSQGVGNAIFSLVFFMVEWIIERGIWNKERFPAFKGKTGIFLLMPISSILMVIALTTMAQNQKIVLFGTIFVIFINMITFYLYDCMSVLYKQEIENQIIEEQMNSYRHQLKLIERSNANIRQLRHDMKHHLLMIHNLTQKEQTQQVYAYLQDIKNFSENPIEYVNTGNEAIDAMLNYKILEAKELGAEVDLDVQMPEKLILNEFDMTVILGNLLQNAIDALGQVETKMLQIRVTYHKGVMLFCTKNTYKALDIHKAQGEREKGLGLENIGRIAKKYNGEVRVEEDGENFSVQVMLYVH